MAKNVGMAPNHLICDVFYDILSRKKAFFLGDAGVDGDLIEDVPQFLADARYVVAVDGIEHFIDLFDEVAAQGPMGLGPVPGAAVFAAQARRHVDDGRYVEGHGLSTVPLPLPGLFDETAHGLGHRRSTWDGMDDGMEAAFAQQQLDDWRIGLGKRLAVLAIRIQGLVVAPQRDDLDFHSSSSFPGKYAYACHYNTESVICRGLAGKRASHRAWRTYGP